MTTGNYSIRKTALWAGGYIGLMALFLAVVNYGFNVSYVSDNFSLYFLLPIIVLAVYSRMALRVTGTTPLPRLTNRWTLLWILPWAIILGIGLIAILTNSTFTDIWGQILLVLIFTIGVGIAEESMFRGVVLHQVMSRYGVAVGMLVSALAFSALHAVNVIGGFPPEDVLSQLFSTFIFGMAFAPLAIMMGSIVPLICVHALWDFTVLSLLKMPTAGDVLDTIVSIETIIEIVVAIVGWTVVLLKARKAELPIVSRS